WLNKPHILQHYRERFTNILVDEFQDWWGSGVLPRRFPVALKALPEPWWLGGFEARSGVCRNANHPHGYFLPETRTDVLSYRWLYVEVVSCWLSTARGLM
ncbi:hypothetical protein O5202_25745, partial [Escherichia coli]|nr:hypothetical protein [Escherichia coli]